LQSPVSLQVVTRVCYTYKAHMLRWDLQVREHPEQQSRLQRGAIPGGEYP